MTEQQLDVLPGGIREVARRLHMSARKAYQLAAVGAFPFVVRLGHVYVVPRRAFERFLAGELRSGSDTPEARPAVAADTERPVPSTRARTPR